MKSLHITSCSCFLLRTKAKFVTNTTADCGRFVLCVSDRAMKVGLGIGERQDRDGESDGVESRTDRETGKAVNFQRQSKRIVDRQQSSSHNDLRQRRRERDGRGRPVRSPSVSLSRF